MLTTPLKMRPAALLAVTLLALVLSGCQGLMSREVDLPPTSGADGACVSHCELKVSQCEQRQVEREQTCQAYRSQFQASGRACESRYGSNCIEPVDCIGADVGICRIELRECLLDCPATTAAEPPRGADAAAEPPPAETR